MKTDITSYLVENKISGFFLPTPTVLNNEDAALKKIYATSYSSSPVIQKIIISILTSIITNKVKYFYTAKSNIIDITNSNPNCNSNIDSISSRTFGNIMKELMKVGISPVQYGDNSQYAIYEVKNASNFARFDKSQDFSKMLKDAICYSKKNNPSSNSEEDVMQLVSFEEQLAEIDRLNNEDI